MSVNGRKLRDTLSLIELSVKRTGRFIGLRLLSYSLPRRAVAVCRRLPNRDQSEQKKDTDETPGDTERNSLAVNSTVLAHPVRPLAQTTARLAHFSIDKECPTKLTRCASEGEAANRDELSVRPRWRFLMLRFS
jgi:hypothetical protein